MNWQNFGRQIVMALITSLAWMSESSAQSAQEFTVGTFNIRYDNPDDTLEWRERRNEVADAVRYFDIVGIQEALPHQWAELEERLPLHESFGRGRDAEGGGEACPVFWNRERYDFLTGEVRWLSRNPNEAGSVGWDADLPRIVTLVVLYDRYREQTIRILNTHWSHTGEEARLNASALLAGWSGWEDQSDNDLVVLCGDLNATENQLEVVNLKSSANLQDTYDAAKYRCRKEFGTYTTFLPENLANATRIDYIFFRGAVKVDWACADEFIKYGVYISDHMPYHAVFK